MKRKFIFVIILIISIKYIYSLDYTIPPNTYSIQSGDFNNDGDNDIVVGHIYGSGCISFLENESNGEFVLIDTLRHYGSNLIHGIVNLDENITPDIIFDGQNDESSILYIIFNNDFTSLYSYSFNLNAPVHPLSFGDFDGDGDYDLVFSSWGAGLDNLWGVMYNLGNREFSEPEWFECPNQAGNAGFYELECRDLDNNGYDDIIAYTPLETYIYYSDGNSFEQDSLNCYAPNGGMVTEDFDNDSDYDIIVTHWPGGSQSHFLIYENLEDHQFFLHDVTFNSTWGQPISVDINGEGLYDIVNVGNLNGISVFYNTGNMQFNGAVYESVVSYGEDYFRSTFSDFDGNGSEDVAIIRYGIEENNLTILYNDGEGNFLDEPQVSVENYELEIANYKLTNYPNPFNSTTTISYHLGSEQNEQIMLEIYNIKGQKVFSKMNLSSEGSVLWSCDNQTSGIYLIEISNSKQKYVKKITYLK